MKEKYSKIIKKYEDRTVNNEVEVKKLMRVRDFYRIRRPEFLGNTMLIVSFLPVMVAMVATMFLANMDNAEYINWVVVGIAAVFCFVVAPIVVSIEKRKLKDLNHLANGKTKDDIIVDDFRNYYDRLILSSEIELNSAIIESVEEEQNHFIDREKLIEDLKKDYDISQKETVNNHNLEEVETFKCLDKEYKKELEKELKRLAIVNFFGKCFKQDVLRVMMNGMMVGMIAMLIMNIPMISGAMQGNSGNGNVIGPLILNILLPAAIGVLSPAIILMWQRHRFKNALQTIYNEIEEPLNFGMYEFEVKQEIDNKIKEIENKIVLNAVKTELIINQ